MGNSPVPVWSPPAAPPANERVRRLSLARRCVIQLVGIPGAPFVFIRWAGLFCSDPPCRSCWEWSHSQRLQYQRVSSCTNYVVGGTDRSVGCINVSNLLLIWRTYLQHGTADCVCIDSRVVPSCVSLDMLGWVGWVLSEVIATQPANQSPLSPDQAARRHHEFDDPEGGGWLDSEEWELLENCLTPRRLPDYYGSEIDCEDAVGTAWLGDRVSPVPSEKLVLIDSSSVAVHFKSPLVSQTQYSILRGIRQANQDELHEVVREANLFDDTGTHERDSGRGRLPRLRIVSYNSTGWTNLKLLPQ